jgi:hypothetical protein
MVNITLLFLIIVQLKLGLLEDVLKVFNVETDPSPNLSPGRGEALKTPFPCREGGKGG